MMQLIEIETNKCVVIDTILRPDDTTNEQIKELYNVDYVLSQRLPRHHHDTLILCNIIPDAIFIDNSPELEIKVTRESGSITFED